MALGKQIKHHRTLHGWTLEDLSMRSGVDVGTISALEVRDSKRSEKAQALAKALGLTLDQLLDDSVVEGGADSRDREDGAPVPVPVPVPVPPREPRIRDALRCLRDALASETPGVRRSVVAIMADLADRAEDVAFSDQMIERIMGAMGHLGKKVLPQSATPSKGKIETDGTNLCGWNGGSCP
ncbi:XRE family transcriptional regulator [Verminephrobacter aporrectodeae subsp. tuberculatae]|uniref:XRE family transcriptional regulator n=1 Tax=Verminephrobacter aporrectodeae subsp. tuberculatae TaxID=1110392 RepID=A0ABT3KND0_9BURK|nr:helix-turn-helix transcriptional regulator [Verminephrobacter aporrectodeae]MCW5319657.1 XRE family transcriptional regulator [Verminephrobacter aporrectodeae subsp. tuberculatae]